MSKLLSASVGLDEAGSQAQGWGGTEEVARLSPLALGRQPEVKAKPISSIPSPPPGLPKKGLL